MTRSGKRRLGVGWTVLLCASSLAISAEGDVRKSAAEQALVARYTFDEAKGDTVRDTSGNGNHGKIHGATFVKGLKGTALHFNGETAYVDCGDGATLNVPGREMTISVWLKVDHRVPGNRLLVSKKAVWNDNEGYYLGLRADIEQVEVSGSSGLVARLHGEGLSTGWHHLAALIRDSGKDIRAEAYIDGKKLPGACLVSAFVSGPNHLYLGCCRPDSAGYFKGAMDELAIYARALSADEIARLYRSQGRHAK